MDSICKALLAGLAWWMCACDPTFAATFSHRGNFSQDDDVQLISFSLASASNVAIRTYSYGGGIQADGTLIPAGGFDPIVTLFKGDGLPATLVYIGHDDDDLSGTVSVDPVTAEAFDSLFARVLTAGSYTVALSQFDNFAITPTLADGFSEQGNGNFTGPGSGCSEQRFCDDRGDNRTSAWAFDIIVTEVPEPSAYALLLVGLGCMCWLRSRAPA